MVFFLWKLVALLGGRTQLNQACLLGIRMEGDTRASPLPSSHCFKAAMKWTCTSIVCLYHDIPTATDLKEQADDHSLLESQHHVGWFSKVIYRNSRRKVSLALSLNFSWKYLSVEYTAKRLRRLYGNLYIFIILFLYFAKLFVLNYVKIFIMLIF